MKFGFIGLGKMGSNMVLNLLDHNHKPVVLNRSPQPTRKLAKKGAIPAYSIEELISKLGGAVPIGAGGRGAGRSVKNQRTKSTTPKIIWLMIPAGKPVDQTIASLLPHLKKGDIIIDGGNSYYEDSIKRSRALKNKGIHFLDCGTSGGMEGARHGACMMIGSDSKPAFKKVEKLFKDMCVKNGYGFMGTSGAGHFVKGIHNGIEYGMMGAINEGMKAHQKLQKKFNLNIKEISKVYAHGSIIESRLMSWLDKSIHTPHYLDHISCEVPKGETEDEMRALTKKADLPILKAAIKMRRDSRSGTVCGDYISAMRNQFGGHKFKKK